MINTMKISKIIVITLVVIFITFIQIFYNSCQNSEITRYVEITEIDAWVYKGDINTNPQIVEDTEIVGIEDIKFEIIPQTTKPYVNINNSNSLLIQNSFADNMLVCLKGNIENISIFSDNDYNSAFGANDTLNNFFTITVSYDGGCNYVSEDRTIEDFVKSYPTSCYLRLKLNTPPDSLRKHVFTFHYRETDGDFFETKTKPIQIRP